MLNFLKTKTAKIGGLVVAFAMVATSSASALTQAEATAIITALNLTGSQAAVIQALVSGGSTTTTSSSYDLGTTTMRVGSTGMYVQNLQMFLGISADGKFGPMTAAAVKTWQANHGLNADGVVGPMTRSAMMSSMTTTTNTGSNTGTTTTTSLSGTAGLINDVNSLSQYNNEEVGTNQNNVKVYGFEVEASKEGDIEIKSVKLSTTISNGSGSVRLEDYVDTVRIWQGSTEVASASSADFTRNSSGNYSKTMVTNGAIVRANVTEKFYVTFDAASLDSGDIDSETFTLGVDNIRFMDGAGVVTTDATTGDLPVSSISVKFVSFATAADTELKIKVSSSSPKEGVKMASTTSDTDDVTFLTGTFEVEGTSDVWVDSIPFLFTTDATDVDQVVATAYLTIDGQEFSESVTSTTTTAVVTFDNLDMTLTAGKTYTFTVKGDVSDFETTYFDEGDKVKVELDTTRRALMDVQNEQGDDLADSTEVTGTALGQYIHFFEKAPVVEVVSTSITPVDNGSAPTSATAKMRLKVTATGGTIYLNGDDESTAAKEFIQLAVDGGDSTTAVSSWTFATTGDYDVTNSGSDNEYYTLKEGETMYVDITAVVSRGAGGTTTLLSGVKGTSILFGTDSTSDTTRSASSLSFSTLTDLLKSGQTPLDRTSA